MHFKLKILFINRIFLSVKADNPLRRFRPYPTVRVNAVPILFIYLCIYLFFAFLRKKRSRDIREYSILKSVSPLYFITDHPNTLFSHLSPEATGKRVNLSEKI